MKTLLSIPLLTLILAAGQCLSATQLESKAARKSDYYTGTTGSAVIAYTSLDDWLRYRAEDDHPKDIYNRGFIVDDAAVVGPLYDIANELLKHWPGNAPKLSIFVRADTAASVYGAEALIANEILIYYGSLLNVQSDDELAAIVAHELSHVLLGHNSKAKYVRMALQLLEDYESMKNLRDAVRAGHIIETGEKQYKLEFDPSLQDDLIKANERKKRATELYYGYHGSILGRPAEIKADLLAADLLINAGYSPKGLKDTLDRLGSSYTVQKFVSEAMEESSKTLMQAVELSMSEQIANLQSQIDNLGNEGEINLQGVQPSISLQAFSTDLNERLKTSATEFAWRRFKTSHPVPKKRVESLSRYLEKNYGLVQREKTRRADMLSNYRQSGMQAIADYKKLEEVSVALIEGDIDAAAAQSIASLDGSNDSDPYKRYTTHRIRREQNQLDSAIANVERIDNYYSVPTNALIEMTDLLTENGKSVKAGEIIGNKERYGYTVPDLYPSKIDIALAQEKPEQAKAAAVECIGSTTAPKDIKTLCAGYGLLDDAEAAALDGGILGGLKSAAESLGNALNPKKSQ